jgi:hypothetical protein
VGDRDTAQLAKRIRHEEERMAKFLTAELPRLVKDVVRAEIPRDQRAATTTRRRTSTRAAAARGSRTSSGSSRSSSAGNARSRPKASRSRAKSPSSAR